MNIVCAAIKYAHSKSFEFKNEQPPDDGITLYIRTYRRRYVRTKQVKGGTEQANIASTSNNGGPELSLLMGRQSILKITFLVQFCDSIHNSSIVWIVMCS